MIVCGKLFLEVAAFRGINTATLDSIRCVYVVPHKESGLLLMAMNGYQMALAHDIEADTDGVPEEGIHIKPTAELLKFLRASKYKPRRFLEISPDHSHATVKTFNSDPLYICPASIVEEHRPVGWNGYLSGIFNSVQEEQQCRIPQFYPRIFELLPLNGADCSKIELYPTTENGAMLVLMPSRPECIFITMPAKRIDEYDDDDIDSPKSPLYFARKLFQGMQND